MSVDVAHEAVGALALPLKLPVVHMVLAPSLMITVPVGVLLPPERVTVAVKVTNDPYVEGFVDELTAVVVLVLEVGVSAKFFPLMLLPLLTTIGPFVPDVKPVADAVSVMEPLLPLYCTGSE